MYKNRDMGINLIQARKDQCCYGMGLGIMVLDDVYPGFPGDVRNASAFPYPIQYEIVEGVTGHDIVCAEDKRPLSKPILQAAKKLERMGCRAIAAECGYFSYFQKEVAGNVDIPVFMSSLIQVPFIQSLIGPNKDVGIVCISKWALSEAHLANVGIEIGSNYVVTGALDENNCTEFENLWVARKRPQVPEAYYDKTEQQMIDMCLRFKKGNPSIGALMLECTGMQPFARAVQRAVDLPVFSWSTLMDYVYSAVVHRDFYGHV